MKKEIKICTTCRIPKELSAFYWHRGRKHRMASCIECNKRTSTDYQLTKRKEMDPRFVFMSRAAEIRYRCKTSGLIVMQGLGKHLLNLWNEGVGRCYFTGRQLHIDGNYHTDPDAATVDRLNSTLGYIEGNVVLAAGIVNRVKQDLSIDQLLALVDEIRAHMKRG